MPDYKDFGWLERCWCPAEELARRNVALPALPTLKLDDDEDAELSSSSDEDAALSDSEDEKEEPKAAAAPLATTTTPWMHLAAAACAGIAIGLAANRMPRLARTLFVALASTRLPGASAQQPSFKPGQPFYDTSGNVIDAHGGGFLLDNGRYYWYGSSRKDHPDPPGKDRGINLYSSNDLYHWDFESLVVKPFIEGNSTSNENGLDLERPKVLKCYEGHYVMWLRGTPIINGTLLKVGVLTSKTTLGPWQWVYKDKGNSNPFRLVGNKYQYGDATLWQDESTGKSYVYWRAHA